MVTSAWEQIDGVLGAPTASTSAGSMSRAGMKDHLPSNGAKTRTAP